MIENEWTYYVNTNERIAKIIPIEDQVPGDNANNTEFTLKTTQISFYETDHLGNTRIVFSPEKFNGDGSVDRKIHFAADYYPYGKTLRYFETSTFEEKYLTTQHERDRETGFDYRHARIYDSEIGRFLSLDPLASQYPAWSDYNYVLGNPIMLIDPDGREAKETKWTENHKRLNETFGMGGFNELIDEQCDDCPDKKYVFGKATTYLEPTKENKSYIGPSSFVNRAAEIANTQHWNNYYNQQKLIYSPMKPFVLIGEGLQIGSIAWPTPFGVSAGVAKLGKIWNTVRLSMKGSSTVTKGVTVIGEGMLRVEVAASKIPGAKILNNMPKFTGSPHQVTSQMMQYNRQWILNEMRSGRTILDIGRDLNRVNPSIFYQMEQNMLKNYQKLNSGSLNIIKP